MTDMNIINRRLEISSMTIDELIENVLAEAFMGGIVYWADNISCQDIKDMKKVGGWKHEYLTKTKKKDAVMYIHDAETGEKYPMTKKSIIDALQKLDTEYSETLDRILSEQYDADDADIVVQTACFGKIVFG